MISNTLIYFLARGIPGIIAFIGIAVYTRILSPNDFGNYTLIVAASCFLNSILFQWLNMSILRYLPGNKDNRESILSTILFSFVIVVLSSVFLAGAAYMIMPPSFYKNSIIICLLLFWMLGLSDITLQIISSSLKPIMYGVISIVKALASLSIGTFFVQKGLGRTRPYSGNYCWDSVVNGVCI